MLFRRIRLLFWFSQSLFARHTKATILGLILGITATIVVARLTSLMLWLAIIPTERIGIVGEFTPSNLPLEIQREISLGLTTLSANGLPQPGLAQAWEATDSGKTFIFKLKDNVFWHKGDLAEARDVNYNIKNVTFLPESNTRLKVLLAEPYAPLPVLVAKPLFRRGLDGLGSSRVAKLILKGDIVQYLKLVPLTRTAKIKEYRFYRTEAQAILAYKLGEIDSLPELSSANALTNWGKLTVEENVHYDRIVTLFFNTKDKVLSERSIRQALGYALPKIEEEPALTPFNPTSWAYFDQVRHYGQNPTQAQKLLTASGITPGSISLTITTFAPYVELAQKIAKAWTDVGINTKVKIESTVTPEFQVLLAAQNIPPDPDQYPLWHSTQQQINLTGYSNAKVDKLLEDGRRELDEGKRKKIYTDFQKFLVEDAPAIFYYYPKTYSYRRDSR